MIRIFWVAVCTAIVEASPLTKDEDGSRIMNGQIATEGQFPFVVSLQETGKDGIRSHSCTMSLITSKTCLGAAHCVVYEDGSLSNIETFCGIVGSFYQDEKSDCHKLADVRVHEDYDGEEVVNDIALFIFEDAIDLTGNAKTIKIAGPGKDIKDKEVTSLGWGITKENGTIPHRLRYTSLRVTQQSLCERINNSLPVRDDQVCLFGDNTGTCSGDSGGPIILAKSNVQIALVSYGESECDTLPFISTDVRMFNKWIMEHAEGEPEVEN